MTEPSDRPSSAANADGANRAGPGYHDPLAPRSLVKDEKALALFYDDEFEECFAQAVEVYAHSQAELHGISVEAGRGRAVHFLAWLKYPELEEKCGGKRIDYARRALGQCQKDRDSMVERGDITPRLTPMGPSRKPNVSPLARVVQRPRERRGRRAGSSRARSPSRQGDDDPSDDADPLDRLRGLLGLAAWLWRRSP